MPFDIDQIRKDFPMIDGKPLIYFDSAATALKPTIVIDAVSTFYKEEYGTVHRAVYPLAEIATEKYSNVRRSVQKFIHAKHEDEIIFTRGTTESINLIANTYGRAFLKEGDEVLISVMEHHSNIVPWQLLCEEKKAHLKAIPINDRGELIIDAFEKLLSDRTKIVSIAHISNSTGTINPIEQIIKRAHQKGAVVVIDGAQAAAHMPLDMLKLDADFYAFSGHKMYGPTGVGILYGKKDLLEKMPPFHGGGDMIESVTIEKTTFQKPPLKFEAGTPMIAQVIGLGKAIEYLEAIGLDHIARWENHLLEIATEKLLEIEGLKLIGTAEKKSAILSFTIKDIHPLDIGTLLGLKGIAVRTGHLCAQPTLSHFDRDSLVRVSFALYNTPQEVDFFIAELKKVIHLFFSQIPQ